MKSRMRCVTVKLWERRKIESNGDVDGRQVHRNILSTEDCFCTVTEILGGVFIVRPPGIDCATSCGTAAAGARTGVEGLDGESIITESGTSLGMGRLIIGQRGGGERPLSSEGRVD